MKCFHNIPILPGDLALTPNILEILLPFFIHDTSVLIHLLYNIKEHPCSKIMYTPKSHLYNRYYKVLLNEHASLHIPEQIMKFRSSSRHSYNHSTKRIINKFTLANKITEQFINACFLK